MYKTHIRSSIYFAACYGLSRSLRTQERHRIAATFFLVEPPFMLPRKGVDARYELSSGKKGLQQLASLKERQVKASRYSPIMFFCSFASVCKYHQVRPTTLLLFVYLYIIYISIFVLDSDAYTALQHSWTADSIFFHTGLCAVDSKASSWSAKSKDGIPRCFDFHSRSSKNRSSTLQTQGEQCPNTQRSVYHEIGSAMKHDNWMYLLSRASMDCIEDDRSERWALAPLHGHWNNPPNRFLSLQMEATSAALEKSTKVPILECPFAVCCCKDWVATKVGFKVAHGFIAWKTLTTIVLDPACHCYPTFLHPFVLDKRVDNFDESCSVSTLQVYHILSTYHLQ